MNQLIDPFWNRRIHNNRRYAGPHNSRRGSRRDHQSLTEQLSQGQVQRGRPVSRPQVVTNINQPMSNQGRHVVRGNRELYLQVEKLKLIAAEQAQVIAEQKEQLQIKSDAIRQQTEDIKKLDSDRLWMRAALQQAEQGKDADAQEDTDWQEKYARLQAETDNLRKRLENRSVEKVREERNRILMDMLPLADHLELALNHSEPQVETVSNDRSDSHDGSQGASLDVAFIGNIRATQSAFLGTLQRYDIEPIDALGQPFDPTIHEAVGQTEETDIPADHVAQVLQTGYRDGERLLRPARVMVSRG